MNTNERLSDREVAHLSSQLKLALEPLAFEKEFTPVKSSNESRRLTAISGVAAAVISFIAYAFIGQGSVSSAWSANPIPVNRHAQQSILRSCSALIPTSDNSLRMHLVDFRGTYGDAVLISTRKGTPIQTWICQFTKSASGIFEAIHLNTSLFRSIQEKVTAPVTVTVHDKNGIRVYPTMKIIQTFHPVTSSIVGQGDESFNGVKIPASQILSGQVKPGAVSVHVKCPNLADAVASIDTNQSDFFTIWLPTTSTQCNISYFDRNGRKI